MTTTTPDAIAIPEARQPSSKVRFSVAFLIGLILTTTIGVGALYAYDQQQVGRILPGVSIGGVDVGGLDPTSASERLQAEYASLGEGEIVINGPAGAHRITYAEIGRGPDIEAMLSEAAAVGRSGGVVERIVADVRTAVRGVALTPRVTYDTDRLAQLIEGHAASLARQPQNASIRITEKKDYVVVPGTDGRVADPSVPIAEAATILGALDAPAQISVDLPVAPVAPRVTTAEAQQAKTDAERLTAKIAVEVGDKKHSISQARLRSWVTFGPIAGRSYGPTIDTTELDKVLQRLARKIDKPAINASFTTSGGRISGVTPSHAGRKMNVKSTNKAVVSLLAARAAGAATGSIEPTLKVIEPALTTAEAKDARPRMKRISSWTTYFPITEKNGFGANIWIPARLIDGYVVPPRGNFDFWDAVGPVTRAKGYRQGGAIINGRTEPQGALAGGICSCSTTLFNAALRAGYEMGARRNHYYYIDRYPLGLDATVFISGSGSKQSMSFTNDTDYPILIRGRGWREGGSGYVRFDIFSVPNGRKVTFSRPTVRNVRPGNDSVQYTTSLPRGSSQRIEYPVDGKQVWVTRSVRSRKGKLIHRETYYSNYARITGIVLIGRG